MPETVDFIGYKLYKEGLSPQEDKFEAIHKAPVPINVHELKSDLGLVNYYSKYCYNLAQVISPLLFFVFFTLELMLHNIILFRQL